MNLGWARSWPIKVESDNSPWKDSKSQSKDCVSRDLSRKAVSRTD